MIEIVCGPMDESPFTDEISFVCSLFQMIGANLVSVMYGLACAEERLWERLELPPLDLLAFIERSIDKGIYLPAQSDLFITGSDQLTVLLCHEADIHVTTGSPAIIGRCASRWLLQNQRLLRSDEVPPARDSWREIRTLEEATAGL
jgi:hypothetical protein